MVGPKLIAMVVGTMIQGISANCECGFSAKVGRDKSVAVFTDLVESDFTGIAVGIDRDNGEAESLLSWVPQEFSIGREGARGEFGENFRVDNVRHGHGSLHLVVRSAIEDDHRISTAEMDSKRLDMFQGSFRAAMKLTVVPGTCAAFFWYHDDSQEIDMEFLSREFDQKRQMFPVNLVLQSKESVEAGYDASKAGNFVRVNLPFDPTSSVHEYRIDYLDEAVIFYADGMVMAEMNGSAVPTSGGHLIISHWSNGNELWSGGPPDEDAVLSVAYVKAYFNSSDSRRMAEWDTGCHDSSRSGAVCEIPDVAENKDAQAFFFTAHENMTSNQKPDGRPPGKSDGEAGASSSGRSLCHSVLLPMVIVSLIMLSMALMWLH